MLSTVKKKKKGGEKRDQILNFLKSNSIPTWHFSLTRLGGLNANYDGGKKKLISQVSTTADVLQEEEEEYSPSVQHEFVTFDLDEPLPPPPPIRGGEWTFDTLRKTTPV